MHTSLAGPQSVFPFAAAQPRKLHSQMQHGTLQPTCETCCSQAMSSVYSDGSKLVMPPLTPAALCSSHQSIILSYARAASSSWSKHPSDVGLPLRLHS